MRLNEILIERISRSHPVIIVDVQPAYNDHCKSVARKLMKFLNFQNGEVLAYFNGDGSGLTDDNEYNMHQYFIDNGLDEDKINDIQFVEKEYAFFRAWMDEGMSEGDIIKVLRLMNLQGVNDSRDLEPEDLLDNLFGDDYPHHDPIYFPDINISQLKRMNGAMLCGGGRHECLKEIQLLMSVYNIKYKLAKNFIYG